MIGVAWLGISFCSLRDRCKEHPILQQLPHQPAGPTTSLKLCPLEKILTQQARAKFNSNHRNSNTNHCQSCSSVNHKSRYLGKPNASQSLCPSPSTGKQVVCKRDITSSRNVDSPPCFTTISEPKNQVLLGLSPLGWLIAQQGLQIYVLQLVKHGSKTSSNLQPSIYANINPVLIHRDQCNHTLGETEHFETPVTGSTPPSLNHLQ